jgi:hypothetical protein
MLYIPTLTRMNGFARLSAASTINTPTSLKFYIASAQK